MSIRSARLILFLMVLFASRTGTARAQQNDIRSYTTIQGDEMHLLAVRFYTSADAAQALYEFNSEAFSDAYERNRRENPSFDTKVHPKGKGTIFMDTNIQLPKELVSARGIIYPRRPEPMSREEAQPLAARKNGIGLAEVMAPLVKLRQKFTAVRRAEPPQGVREAVTKTAGSAKREKTPLWYSDPSNPMKRCAKSVCDKYQSLCYYECVAVAKRFSDAGASCLNLPESLPYMVNSDGRKDCSAALQ